MHTPLPSEISHIISELHLFYFSGTANRMFFAANSVKVSRDNHQIKQRRLQQLNFRPKVEKVQYLSADCTAMGTIAIPDPEGWLSLSLGATMARWDMLFIIQEFI